MLDTATKLDAAGELPFALPLTVMSPITKLDVASENVAVKDKVLSDTTSESAPSEDVIDNVGAVVSVPIAKTISPE